MKYVSAAVGTPRRAKRPGTALKTKIGGCPVGIQPEDWPQCRKCGRDLDFLLQLDLQHPVAVSRRFRFAYLFYCTGYRDRPYPQQCESFASDSVSNRVLLVSEPDPASIVEGRGVVRYDDFTLSLKIRHEPVVDSEDYSLPDKAFLTKDGLTSIRDDTSCTVKIGGTPVFLQTPEEVTCPVCSGPMKFIAQIGTELEDFGSGGYSFNTGDGELFVFRCDRECSPDGVVMYEQMT